MRVTIKQIASKLGVNPSTVSRALSGKSGVSDQLREKIVREALKMGYFPDMTAMGLRKGHTKVIGVLIPDISNPFFAQAVRGMEKIFYPMGYQLILCSTEENSEREAANLRMLVSQRVEGLLSAPVDSGGNAVIYKKIHAEGIPIVFFDRLIPDLKLSSVITDNEQGIRDLMEYLHRKGHRKLGIINLRGRSFTGKVRLRSAIETAEKLGIDIKQEWIKDGNSTQSEAYEATVQMLSLKSKPTAIIVNNNLMMLGTMKALRDLKINVPKDVSLVGFDDSYWNQIFDPPISCVAQDPEQMGLIAATMLLDAIFHHANPVQTVLKAHFIERESVSVIS